MEKVIEIYHRNAKYLVHSKINQYSLPYKTMCLTTKHSVISIWAVKAVDKV